MLQQTGVLYQLTRKVLFNIGIFIIMLSIILATFGYLIIPDSSPNANEQILEISSKPPGFKTTFLLIRKNELIEKSGYLKKIISGSRSLYNKVPIADYTFSHDSIIIAEFSGIDEKTIVRKFHVADIVWPIKRSITPIFNKDTLIIEDLSGTIHKRNYNDIRQQIVSENLVQKKYLLGTDQFGRDMLSRLILGTRISLAAGFIAVLISVLIGLTLGTIAGYFRGVVDQVIMVLINIFWSIPTLLMAIAIILVLGKGFWQLFLAIGLTMWVEIARIVRGQVLSIREKDHIVAVKVLGFNHSRVLLKHIIPNVLNPVIILSAANFASAILIEAGLSFLGIGVQPPVPSWGNILKENYGFLIVDKAYLALYPGLAIVLMVLAFTFIGNSIRDVLDIKK